MNRSGRPRKEDSNNNSRNEIINAAARLIAREGTQTITVRAVCNEAGLSIGTFYYFFKDKNELMMSFITDLSFEGAELSCPMPDIGGRISELYMMLIRRYMSFGREFVRSFYNPRNKILSAYMGECSGRFSTGTVMARSEAEIDNAVNDGIISLHDGITAHEVASDICTIVKGCVFEWCLSDEAVDLEALTERIIRNYMCRYNNDNRKLS